METWIGKLLGLNSGKISELDNWIYESCIDESMFIEFIQDQTIELEKHLWELDLYSLLIEFIAMTADVPELIPFLYNHGAQTTFRILPTEAGVIMAGVSEEDRNSAWFFILNMIEVELPEEYDDS